MNFTVFKSKDLAPELLCCGNISDFGRIADTNGPVVTVSTVNQSNTREILELVDNYVKEWNTRFRNDIIMFSWRGSFPSLELYELQGVKLRDQILQFINEEILPKYIILHGQYLEDDDLQHYYLDCRYVV